MNAPYFLAVGVAVAAAAGTLAVRAQAEREPYQGPRWEYHEIELPAQTSATPILNRMGADGWELVGVTSACPNQPSGSAPCAYWAYFKRPSGRR